MPMFIWIEILIFCLLFAFGIRLMSDRIRTISSFWINEWITPLFTKGLRSFLMGLFSTMILGLSSVVCILTLSFYDNHLISKKNAWRVVAGANVGTTLTPWLVLLLSFHLPAEYVLIVFLLSGLILFLSNSYFHKNIGLSFLGFSLMVLAILIFARSTSVFFNYKFFETIILQPFHNEYIHGLILILIGSLIAFSLQSSSVAISFFLMMLRKGITIEHSIYLVIGANIGTTFIVGIAQLLFYPKSASIAKFHIGFNLLGSVLFIFLVPAVLKYSQRFLPSDEYVLAFFHTFFNVITASLVLPIIHFLHLKEKNNDVQQLELVGPKVDFLGIHRDMYESQLIQSAHKLKQSLALLQRISTESSLDKISELIERIKKNETLSDELIKFLKTSLITYKNSEILGSWIPYITAKFQCAYLLERAEDTILKIAFLHFERKSNHYVITPKLRLFIFEIDEILLEAVNQLLIFWGRKPKANQEFSVKTNVYSIAEKAEKHLIKSMKNHSVSEITALHYKEILNKYKFMSDLFEQLYDCIVQTRQ